MNGLDKNRVLETLGVWNFWERDLDTGIEREGYVQELLRLLSSGQVVIVSGVRRSGKSYILRQAASRLIEQNRRRKEVVIVNFEDIRLEIKNARELQRLWEIIEEHLGEAGPRTVFLDEVQKVEGWEAWARTMHELRKAKVVVSGSNSRLLSAETGTKLTGRHLDLAVYPLSLAEFVKFKGGDGARLYLRSYLKQGGFPLAILEPQMGEELVLSYLADVLQRGVIDRYQVRKKTGVVELAKYVVGNFSNLMTFGSLAKFLDLTPVTVRQFMDYLQEAYLIFVSERFSFKPKLVEKSPRKVYCVDTGLANLVGVKSDANWGRLAENAVYLELLRRGKQVFYWKDDQHREVDLVVWDGSEIESVIQVCWDLNDVKTKRREVKSLGLGMEELGVKEGLVLTEDFEGEEVVKGKPVKYRKLAEWLAADD